MVDENKNQEDPGTDLTTSFAGIEGVAERPKSTDRSDRAGIDDINPNELRLPRLAIAQGLSPQMTPGDAQYIEGLKLFEMFNDLTAEIYGRGPILFVPVRRDVRRIEFIPRSQGGGIVDMNVPANDPRLRWTTVEGTRVPPRATTFVEFVILMLLSKRAPEAIVLSIKTTNKWNRRAADQLTTFIKLRDTAIYSGLYKVDTLTPAKNDKGTFGVPVCKNAGWIPKDTPAGAQLYEYAKSFHDSLQGKDIVVDRDLDTTDADETAGEGEVAHEGAGTEKVPF